MHCFAWKGCHYFLYQLLQEIAAWITQDAKLRIVDALLMLIFRLGQCLCRCSFCLFRLPIRRLCITATNSLFNCLAFKTKNCWRSFDADINILSRQNLLWWITVCVLIWIYWFSFGLSATQPFGNAVPSKLHAWVALILLTFKYLAEWFISPAILLYINQYSHATAHYSAIILL